MSHFNVMIITGEEPTGDLLAEILQPWHEFACTGVDDRYVVDIDETADLRSDYETATKPKLRDPAGRLHDRYEDRFYRDPTDAEIAAQAPFGFLGSGCSRQGLSYMSRDWGDGLGYRAKVHQIPDGFVEVYVPAKDETTFAAWVRDGNGYPVVAYGQAPGEDGKHGYILLGADGAVAKIVRRTNPNHKWDWWSVGGRWTGMLKLKPGARGEVGSPGLMTDPAAPGFVDMARLADIDVDGMRDKDGAAAAARYDEFRAIVGEDATWNSWPDVRAAHGDDIDGARRAYHAQDAIRRVRESGTRVANEDDFAVPREVYIRDARDRAFTAFAIVKDGRWFERGAMGWWGCVANQQDRTAWNARCAELLEGLPAATTWLTIVDCHT